MPETASIIFIIVYLLIWLFLMALSTVAYVLTAYSFYKMAKACNLKHPWMSFIPVTSNYLTGQIADVHCSRNEGKKTSYGKILLWLGIALGALCVLLCAAVIVIAIVAALNPNASAVAPVMIGVIALIVAYVAMMALSVVLTIFYYIALYKVFKLYDPSNAALFLVLCIFVSIAMTIILILLARKDPQFLDTVGQQPDAGYTPVFTTDYSL